MERNLKFIFASDSFKGSLSSKEAAELLTKAAKAVFPDCICVGVPVADGGEGTVDAVVSAAGGEMRPVTVCGPLMEKAESFTASFPAGGPSSRWRRPRVFRWCRRKSGIRSILPHTVLAS